MNKNDIKMMTEGYKKVLVKENDIPRIGLPPNPVGSEQIGPEYNDVQEDKTPISKLEFKSCMNTIDDKIMRTSDKSISRVWQAIKNIIADNEEKLADIIPIER